MSASSSFTTGSGLQDVNRANVTDIGQIYKSNVNLIMVDPGALAAGGELAHLGIAAATSAVENMTDVAGELLAFSGGVLEYSAQENERNRAFAGQAANMVGQSTDNVLRLVSQAGTAVLNFARGESDDNRAFAGQAAQMVADEARGARADLLGAYDGTLDHIQKLTDKSFSLVGGAFSALDSSFKTSIDAITDHSIVNMQFLDAQAARVATNAASTLNGITTFVGELFGQTDARNAAVMKEISTASAANIAAVSDATRSDAAKSMDNLVKVAGLTVAVVAGFMYYSRGR